MFETMEDVLSMLWLYAVVGFFLAVLYNVFRFFRLSFPYMKKMAAALDIIFAVIAGFVLFAFSVDNGTGFFRLYYVVAAAFGFAVNMVTVGMAIPPLARLFGKVWHIIAEALMTPVRFICQKSTDLFIKIGEILSENAEKYKKYLKKHRKVMYNNYDHKIGELYPEGGEHRNAVKAKVRKIV